MKPKVSCNPIPERTQLFKVAGKLLLFHSEWKELFNNHWLNQLTSKGYLLEFERTPPLQGQIRHYSLSKEDSILFTQEVSQLLEKGAIELCTTEMDSDGPIWYSPVFVVPKKGGGRRPIIDCREINRFIIKEHFQMESMLTIKSLLLPKDWMVKIDLKDAYFHIGINKQHQNYLRFQWQGEHYRYTCLPFGVTSAPRVFTKVTRPLMAHLRGLGIRTVIYIDDLLILAKSKEEAEQHRDIVLSLLQHLGWTINWEKSNLQPSQTCEYLGLIIDSIRSELRIPTTRKQQLRQDLKRLTKAFNNRTPVTTRQLATIIGKLGSLELAVFPIRLKTRQMMALKNANIFRGWDATLLLTAEVHEEIMWWLENLSHWNGRLISPPLPTVWLTSDASKTGWGGSFENNLQASGFWAQLDKELGINCLELMAGLYTLQSFEELVSGEIAALGMDNTTAVSYINKQGGGVQHLNTITQRIWNWCLQRDIYVRAYYLPGTENTTADTLSRKHRDRNDWKLKPEFFSILDQLWGPHTIDLFATHLNKQTERFFSWRHQPGSSGIDAFNQPWADENGWANPPFGLVLQVLHKVRIEKCQLTLVAPLWPSQAWFPMLLNMLVDLPRLLPDVHDLFLPSSLGNELPLGVPNWTAIAWRISGKPASTRAFRNQLLNSWPRNGQLTLGEIMTRNGVSSPTGGINTLSKHLPLLQLE